MGFYAFNAAARFISFQFEIFVYLNFLYLAAAANYASKLLYCTRVMAHCSSILGNGCHSFSQFYVLLDVVLVLLY